MKFAVTTGIVVVIVLAGFVTVLSPVPASSASNPSRRLGFWTFIPPSDIQMSPTQFADQMFLTPPYPSTMEWMLFGAESCIEDGIAPASCSDTQQDLSYTDGILAVTDQYPNIRIMPQIALYDLGPSYLSLAESYFQYYANNFKGHPSVYAIGLESEYSDASDSGYTIAEMTALMNIANGDGFQFISYGQAINPDTLPSGTYYMGHSNYPVGDGQWVLFWFEDSASVGISTGYDSYTAFPETRPIPSFYTGMDDIIPPIGWSQGMIHLILNDTLYGAPDGYNSNYPAPAASTRQYINLCVGEDGTWGGGISGAVWFTDSAGISTYMLWDNPTLRNWIWTDPDYQPNFILSTSTATTSTTSTTSSASTPTSTSTSSISSTTTSSDSTTSTNTTSTTSTTSTTTTTSTLTTGTSTASSTSITSTTTSTTLSSSSTNSTVATSTTSATTGGAPLALDMLSYCDTSNSQSSCTMTVTTSGPNEVIVVASSVIDAFGGNSADRVLGISDASSSNVCGAFTRRISFASIPGYGNSVDSEEWYCLAASKLTNDVITVTDTGNFGSANVLVAIKGASMTKPFDSNSGYPYEESCGSNTCSSQPTLTGITSDNASDLQLSLLFARTSATESAGAFDGNAQTLIYGAGGSPMVSAEYYITSVTVSSVKSTFGQTAQPQWGMLVDAIAQASTTTTITSTTSSSTTGKTTSSTFSTISSTATAGTPSTSSSSSSSSTSTTAVPIYQLAVVGECQTEGAGFYASGSTAVVTVPAVCNRNGGEGLRTSFWSIDGGQNHTITTGGTMSLPILMNASHVLELYSVHQCELVLDYGAIASLYTITPPSIQNDTYWYDSGTVVTYVGSVASAGFTAVGWALDNSSVTTTSGDSTLFVVPINMTGTHVLHVAISPNSQQECGGTQTCSGDSTADVTLQTNVPFPVSIEVDGRFYSGIVTFSWEEGSVHNVTAPEDVAGYLERSHFSHWEGVSNGAFHTISVLVNGSLTIEAVYSNQYRDAFTFSDASGNPITPQTATLVGGSGGLRLSGNFIAWLNAGESYELTSALYMNSNVASNNVSSFSVDGPDTINFQLQVFPQSVRVTDVYGLPLAGAVVNVTTAGGITFSQTTNGQGIVSFRVPYGLYTLEVSYMGITSQIWSGTEGAHDYTVTVILSYPLLATIGALAIMVAVFAVFRFKRYRGFKGWT